MYHRVSRFLVLNLDYTVESPGLGGGLYNYHLKLELGGVIPDNNF